MSTPLFTITNKHVADCGDAPGLPADFETGPYYRSYFENEHGEQWVFWFNYETKELNLRGGDCGWEKPHKVLAIPVLTVADVLLRKRGRQEFGNLLPQVLLAGQHVVTRILGNVPQSLLFVVDKDNRFVTMSGAEHVWLQACVQATRVELEPLSAATFREMVVEMQNRVDTDEDEDEDGE